MAARIAVELGSILLAAWPAAAQTPPTQKEYQVNLATVGSGGLQFAPGVVPMWLDMTDLSFGTAGRPRPASLVFPMPMQCVAGCTSAGGTQTVAGTVSVSNFPASQPVSGTVAVSSLPAIPSGSNAIGSVSISNFPASQAVTGTFYPATQPVSATTLPLPAGAATAALQAAINSDGGSAAHVTNFPATQPVSGTVAVSTLPAIPAGSNAIGSVSVSNLPVTQAVSVSSVVQAERSGAWTDASFTATATASSPSGLAAVAGRTGLHVFNLGSSTACMNYTSTAVASTSNTSGCASGSVPISAGGAYLEDEPGNVSPEAISFVCSSSSCPLTIKVR